MLTLYNTLSGLKEEFKPLKAGEVSMYVCGPTVYDDPHIGHLRSAYVFDVIRRTIEKSFKVRFVRNVTDIDDKIIERASAEKIPIAEVTAKYLNSYHAALEILGIEPPTGEPKATSHIEEMQDLIQKLTSGGKAYTAGGNVYFSVRSMSDYGALSHQKIDEMYQNVRTEPGEGKKEALDFALWKKSGEGEPCWDSPWGRGRPGWHIECSAMSVKYLGPAFDIHGGGRDLIFPHHENERAQVLAACAGAFARRWLHHGLLTIQGRKMSKSLNNFLTLQEVLRRTTLDSLKLFFLQSHYRSDVDFTWEKVKSLEEALRHFYIFFEKSARFMNRPGKKPRFGDYSAAMRNVLEDDFNTPAAVGLMFDLLHEGNEYYKSGNYDFAVEIARVILEESKVFGLFGSYLAAKSDAAKWRPTFDKLVAIRDKNRSAKNYRVSDFIRGALASMGFEAEDGKSESLILNAGSAISDEELEKKLTELLKQAERMS